ncbi:DUF5320 domain-containing protein [Spirochaeta thermophila]|uniref:DUF5320 domain-containing protein n=1 Tax=Winmispira thermophila (strain ATCC 49972 / DSM 6192 / RI 19.B1) TaxID=665571 RepID=E0RTT0_WINT6|nr:DUF5320 domain-containing protein [Spirochaeta thermophila]ADN02455.1 hypothetical protein STHERM_c15150 [Spirochaeta thermophila DSM 6192]
MPFGDRTGPAGAGPRTGRAAGYCAGFGMPGYANPWGGGGWGRGRCHRYWYHLTGLPGWARGWTAPVAPGWWTPPSPEEERKILESRAAALEREMEALKKRLDELSKGSEEA